MDKMEWVEEIKALKKDNLFLNSELRFYFKEALKNKQKLEKIEEFVENELFYELDDTLLKTKTYPIWKEILESKNEK